MKTTTLEVHGMTCQSCVRHIRDALRLDGVARVDVRIADGRVEIEHDARSSEAALIDAIRTSGYEVGPQRRTGTRGGCCGSC